MNILVIAPHMDDEVLGCGGTILKHVSKNDQVYVCFIAHRVYNHKFDAKKNEVEMSHARKAVEKLGCQDAVFFNLNDERLDSNIIDVIIPLEEYINKIKPEIVYCPFKGDNNQDHRAVFDAVRVAARPSATPFIRKLLMYEVPSSTEQSPPLLENAYLPNCHHDITDFIDQKIDAFRCYQTETRKHPHPRSEQSIKILAQKRGCEVGMEYAEAFVTLRERWT